MASEKNDQKVVYPKLSYKLVGILYDVWNEVGWSHKEKYIENAVAAALRNKGIKFKEQARIDLKFQDTKVGVYYFDFIIDGKIVLELKRRDYFSPQDIRQIHAYLKSSGLKLGILAHFTKDGVRTKRILNIY